MSIESEKLVEISRLYANVCTITFYNTNQFKVQKKEQKRLIQNFESNNITNGTDIQNFNKVVFNYKEAKSRNEAVNQVK